MSQIDIRRLDMSLLLTFASLLHTRQGSGTAKELGVTQSSVSHALTRLRDIFGDELFVRRPHGLEPTRRALALKPLVDDALQAARALVQSPTFAPESAAGVLRIGAMDYHCALLAPAFLGRVAAAAPLLQVSFQPLVRRKAVAAVLNGSADLALGLFWNLPDTVAATPLWTEAYRVVVRRGTRRLREPMTLGAYLAERHLVVSLEGELSGIVDMTLARTRKRRTVVASVPYFMAALAAVAESDLIATVPARLAERYADAFGLRSLPPPLPIRSFTVSAIRRARGSDPMTEWAVGLLTA
jgi:DNA-binding transcriptional LysR family regulator